MDRWLQADEGEVGRGAVRHALMIALLVQGVSGVIGGGWLVWDPSGRTIGLPIEWLSGSPFPDYRVPGLVLLTLLGFVPLLVAWALWTSRPWSRTASVAVGVALTLWIAVEIVVIGYQPDPPLQLLYGALAIVILVLTALDSA